MIRYKAIIEYIGTDFKGWQRQENSISVQQVLEETIAKFTKQELVSVQGAGRTDTGVHALGQVIHFDLADDYPEFALQNSLNYFLPTSISILSLKKCDIDFHARFQATKRHYIYRIINRPARLTVDAGRAWLIKKPLDLELMNQGASHLLGNHDFTSFRSQSCQAPSAIRTIEQAQFLRIGGQELQFHISARSFLHHMVRNIVGTLVLVGAHKIPPKAIAQILTAKDRGKAGATAPAAGLYFANVEY